MRIIAFLAIAMGAFGQIQPSRLGVMLAADGNARPVYGVTASVTIGDPAAAQVLSLGCSKALCLMKMDSSIASPTGTVAAPEGPALFSFDGDSALIFFSETRQLMRWRADQLVPVDFDITGEILAIGNTTFAIRNAAGTRIVGPGNSIVQSLHGATGPVLLLDRGVLFATREALILRRPDASELRFEINRVESLSWLGENYVQVRAGEANYALRVDAGHERMFVLPEPAQ